MIVNCIIAELVAVILFAYVYHGTSSFMRSSWTSIWGLFATFSVTGLIKTLISLENKLEAGLIIHGAEMVASALLLLIHFGLLAIIKLFIDASRTNKNN